MPASWNWTGPGYLEGNPVVGAAGELYVVLRANSLPMANIAITLRVSADYRTLSFERWMPFPGGMSKFDVRRDPVSGKWLSLSNNVTVDWCPSARNVLTLTVSADLAHWTPVKVLLSDDTGFEFQDSVRYSGCDKKRRRRRIKREREREREREKTRTKGTRGKERNEKHRRGK